MVNPKKIPLIPKWLHLFRLLPFGIPGKHRLARFLIRLSGLKGPVQIDAGGLVYALPSIQEPMAHALVRDGQYEPETVRVIQQHLPRSGVFLDVGANVGLFALPAAHHWCPDGRVLAFEASPGIYEYLAHNLETNPAPNLQIRAAAVTARSGDQLTFFDATEDKFGMGSLTSRFNQAGVSVPTISLDDAVAAAAISQVDVIKVDVEGHELGVFQGALNILQQIKPPVIVFEFNDWAEQRPDGTQAGDAQRFLISQGYSIQRLSDYLRLGAKAGPVMESGGAELIAWKA
jgi:FkbM family methyltransferase